MSEEFRQIAVIGGGPAGLMAAYAASLNGKAKITLFERNEKLGKKLFITGKGRCNLTNSGDPEDFFNSITINEKFFYSAFYTFDNHALMSLVEGAGVKLVSERGSRVFPESGKSYDIVKALVRIISKPNIKILLNEKIDRVEIDSNHKFLIGRDSRLYDSVILAGGGASYPATGSDGNIYDLTKKFGHTLSPIKPGLCGLDTCDIDTHNLSGLSLKNVVLSVNEGNSNIFKEIGEMEFTHYGVSGPLVLTASSLIDNKNYDNYDISIDLKPGLDRNKLNLRVQRDLMAEPNKEVKNSLGNLMPYRLMETILIRSGIDLSKKSNQFTKEERLSLIDGLKNFKINVIRHRPIEEAIITRGGINCSEVNPSTMESKIVPGLYIAGEMLDLDAVTGGFNLQIAFSTGYLAGLSASEK